MNTMLSLLSKARLGDPDEPTHAEEVERGIYRALEDQCMMPSGVPAIALKAILWERMKSKTAPDEQDIELGNRLFGLDHSRETLDLLAKWFEGTSLEAAVDAILG